jgi:hypothetical protein
VAVDASSCVRMSPLRGNNNPFSNLLNEKNPCSPHPIRLRYRSKRECTNRGLSCIESAIKKAHPTALVPSRTCTRAGGTMHHNCEIKCDYFPIYVDTILQQGKLALVHFADSTRFVFCATRTYLKATESSKSCGRMQSL